MLKREVVTITALLLVVAFGRAEAERNGSFKVIAHPGVGGSTISRNALGAVFLGKAERWGNGARVAPIDLSAMSAVRANFSEAVLGMPTTAVRRYWEERLMSGGGRPPMVKATEEQMISAVAENEGAIGYVAMETPLPDSVKVLTVQ